MERPSTSDEAADRVVEFSVDATGEGDSGKVETLADGSISIPVVEEKLFVEKRLVVRERIVVRKYTVTEDRVVEGDVRREYVKVEADDAVAGRVDDRLS